MGRDVVERRRPDRPHEEAPRRPHNVHPAAYVLSLQRDMGNQAVQRLLSRPARPVLQRFPYIVQAGYMSGDMFGISAALVLNPKAGVVILQEGAAEHAAKREPDGSELFKGFYEQSLRHRRIEPPGGRETREARERRQRTNAERRVRAEDIPKRVKVVEVNDANAAYKDLLAGGARYGALVRRAAALDARDTFVAPGIATSMVGDAYGEDAAGARSAVRQAWVGGAGPTPMQLDQFLTGKNILRGRKYALLWVRLSAKLKKGGAHAELDTSLQGVRDLKAAIRAQTDRQVVLVGDDPVKPEFLSDAIDMLEFWDEPPFSTQATRVDKRMAQLRLYSHMIQNGYDLVSIGMRSGAMEGPALLGVPTVYIEEQDNQQHERMEKWLNKVPNWTQARVGTLPTRTGRRYKTGATSLPEHERSAREALGAIRAHQGGGSADEVKLRLQNAWHDDPATFQQTFIAASLELWRGRLPRTVVDYDTFVSEYENARGAAWSSKLRGLLATWHDEHGAFWEGDDECREHEEAIATSVESDSDEVRGTLKALPTALDKNAGLADFVRDVAAHYALDAATPELKTALRKWRSAWTGKWELERGFTPADLKLIMDTPKLRQSRFDRIGREQAGLLTEIDALVSETPGTTLAQLGAVMQAGKHLTVDEFRNSFMDRFLAGLRRVLRLAATTTLEQVRAAFRTYTTTDSDGVTWWTTLKAKIAQLHAFAWPA